MRLRPGTYAFASPTAIAPNPAAAHSAQAANFLRDNIDSSLIFSIGRKHSKRSLSVTAPTAAVDVELAASRGFIVSCIQALEAGGFTFFLLLRCRRQAAGFL